MIFKQFRIICSLRIFLLVGSIFILFYLVFKTPLYAITTIVGILIVFQIFSLIRYIEKTNRDLHRFLQAIKYEDFSQVFVGKDLGHSFKELRNGFNEVLLKFQKTRSEKEEHYRYLQTVVQHIGIGLISFQSVGEVQLINKAAKRLLKVAVLKHIKSLATFSKPLVKALFRLQPGERALVKVDDEDELLQFIVYATEFILKEQKYTLAYFQT